MRTPRRDDALRRGLLYFLLLGGTHPSSSGLCVERRVPATRLERGVLQSATLDKLRTISDISVQAFFESGACSSQAWVNCFLLLLGPLTGEALLYQLLKPRFHPDPPPEGRLRDHRPEAGVHSACTPEPSPLGDPSCHT